MTRTPIKVAAFAAMLLLSFVPCFAGEILTFTGGSFVPTANNQTIGWSFTVNTPLQVTDLSWYDPTGANVKNRPVGIWDSAGNLVDSACVGPGCGATHIGNFWVLPISPITLSAGNYVIGGYVWVGTDSFVLGSPTIMTDSRITYGQSMFTVSGSFTEPLSSCCGNGFFGPDFSTAVPEPASMTLLAAGFGIAALRKRIKA